ncbi:MAG: leucine-rich repeat domain-containing protein [Sedimentisphaerales bacterium]|nr:leucine-rich repeat domain-containing protein [Sedimentisphaerales bacterium]
MEENKVVRFLFALFLLVPLAAFARAEDPVYFADPHLKAAVVDELWTPDPTPTDMAGLTSLHVDVGGIVDLTGLEHAVNLWKLHLAHNLICDLSPLSELSNLQMVVLNNNLIRDIGPLSGASQLQHLDVHDNEISDISALSGLTHLQILIARFNQIDDISALSGFAGLQVGDLNHNHISDIIALSELTSLEYVDLRNNPLNDEACDLQIPRILANNSDVDLKYNDCGRRSLSISATAGGRVTTPGEGMFTYDNGEFVPLEAQAEPGFVFAGWSGSYSTQGNPTYLPMGQDHEIRANFLCTRSVLYVDDDAAGDVMPGDAGGSDPLENGTVGRPFDSIQEAIEVAAREASILVRPGTYRENIDFLGKSIQLLGLDPNDPNGTSFPVLDGAGAGPVVTFDDCEDPNCALVGFVITRGRGRSAGAILCRNSSPTVVNCLIVGNRATFVNGAAVYCTDSNAALLNCTIADNYGGSEGAALVLADSEVMLANSILWANRPQEILVSGTGHPSISYTNVAGGWPGPGNLDADPLFVRSVSWVDANDPDVLREPEYPDAVRIDGDYHLQSQAGRWDPETHTWVRDDVTSPCIDAGDPTSALGDEPVPHGGVINLGAHGGTDRATKSDMQP